MLISQSGKLPTSKILNNYLWFLNSCGLDLHKKKRKQKKNIKRKIINLIPFHKFFGYGILPGGQKKNTSFYFIDHCNLPKVLILVFPLDIKPIS